eukprot:6177584-Pleurochrysis_carterae.AAC.1
MPRHHCRIEQRAKCGRAPSSSANFSRETDSRQADQKWRESPPQDRASPPPSRNPPATSPSFEAPSPRISSSSPSARPDRPPPDRVSPFLLQLPLSTPLSSSVFKLSAPPAPSPPPQLSILPSREVKISPISDMEIAVSDDACPHRCARG